MWPASSSTAASSSGAAICRAERETVTAVMTVRLRFGGGLGGTSRVEVTELVLPEGCTVEAALE